MQGKALAVDSLISAVMTEQMKDEIAAFAMEEIKQQISVWIAQNLDKIVEDALRSLKTESEMLQGPVLQYSNSGSTLLLLKLTQR